METGDYNLSSDSCLTRTTTTYLMAAEDVVQKLESPVFRHPGLQRRYSYLPNRKHMQGLPSNKS